MRRRDSMPTPSDDEIVDNTRSSHTTCPPEDDRSSTWRTSDIEQSHPHDSDGTAAQNRLPTPSSPESPLPVGSAEHNPNNDHHIRKMDVDDRSPSQDLMSPVSVDDKQEETGQPVSSSGYVGGSPSTSYDFSNVRLTPSSPSSYLRSGSKFQGSQQSERQVYDVQVEIKHVDMRESFLCGYLRIQGLTEDHPTLTTYFEGEIIGSKYTFLTQHEDWGSTDKVDLQHWAKFSAFRPFQKQVKKGNFTIPNLAQRENIFMRWKEHFLVPDHRVRTISGASFEGFYYICFNQCQGTVSGIYFHAKSEKFQQLELKHVPDRGCFSAMEFR